MEFTIRASGVKVTDGMREYIEKRMAKLDRLATHVIDAQLELRSETTRTGALTSTAQITLKTGKHVLRSEAEAPEPAKAVDMAVDKLVNQVRRFNDRKRRRSRKPLNEIVDALPLDDQAASATPANEELAPQIARTKSFQMEPMEVETAIEQMELIGHDFFFFKNAEDETFTVLYRRKDGTYGLLSPD